MFILNIGGHGQPPPPDEPDPNQPEKTRTEQK